MKHSNNRTEIQSRYYRKSYKKEIRYILHGDRSVDTVLQMKEAKTDHPYTSWVRELHEMPALDSEGKNNRMKWVQEKLYKTGSKFSTEYTQSDTEITMVNFIDRSDEPCIVIVIPVHQVESSEVGKVDFANSIVQMILLAENLKTAQNYVNVQLLFVNPVQKNYWIKDVHEFLLVRHIPGLVGTIVVPYYITGSTPICCRDNWSASGEFYDIWIEEENCGDSDDCISESMFDDFSYFENSDVQYMNFSTALIGFGDANEYCEDAEQLEDIPRRQIEFSKSKEFLRVQALLLNLSATLSRFYSRYELDTEYIH